MVNKTKSIVKQTNLDTDDVDMYDDQSDTDTVNDTDIIIDDIEIDNENLEDVIEVSDDESDKEDEDSDKECYYNFAENSDSDMDGEVFDDDTELENEIIISTRITKPILTEYEFVRILGDRTQQIALGSKPLIKNIDGLSPKEIALLEIKNKIIPLIIERPLPNGLKERWKLSELSQRFVL
jgi:DNA-directed RNA polymerase subunit K/omega